MNIDNFKDIAIATAAGAAFGYLAFAVQEVLASNERIQKELVVWQSSKPVPKFQVSDDFVKHFKPGWIEKPLKKKYGTGF